MCSIPPVRPALPPHGGAGRPARISTRTHALVNPDLVSAAKVAAVTTVVAASACGMLEALAPTGEPVRNIPKAMELGAMGGVLLGMSMGWPALLRAATQAPLAAIVGPGAVTAAVIWRALVITTVG